MIKSKIISLANKYHFYALLVLLCLLPFIHYLYIIPLILYIIYLLIFKLFNKYTFILIILTLSLFTLRINIKSSISINTNTLTVNIKEAEYSDNYTKYIAKYNLEYVIIYDYNKTTYIEGDNIEVSGDIKDISNFNDFDYVTYSKSKRIYKTISAKSINYINHSNNLYYLRYLIESRYKNNMDNIEYTYFNSLILAKSISDESLADNIQTLGISYMFVVSGFHISFMVLIIEKILKLFIKKNDLVIDIISISIIFIYSILTGFPIGILRAFLMLIVRKLNKRCNLLLTNLDIVSITFIISIFINPLFIFQAAFKYSFITTLFIILSSSLIKTNNKVLNAYLTTILCFISSLPLTINLNYSINFLSIIISPILLTFLTYIIMPISYILLLIPDSISIFKDILSLYTTLINKLSQFDSLIIKVKELNPIFIVIFYVLLFIVLISLESKKNYKIIPIFITYLLLIFNINTLSNFTTLTMINVNQGDSFLVESNNKYLCIDSYLYNISYIKSQGIKHIDSLIITHSDNDHINTAEELIKEFDVDNLYLSIFDKCDTTNNLTTLVDNVYYLSRGDSFYFSNTYVNVLGPIVKNSDLNNNCLVFTMNINASEILFCGDCEEEEENQIFNSYLNVDILKVPHHGSNSSMGENFMKYVSFDTALISVGLNNKYGHPASETLSKLENKNVFKTSTDGSVKIYFTKNKYFIYTKRHNRYLLDLLDFNL